MIIIKLLLYHQIIQNLIIFIHTHIIYYLVMILIYFHILIPIMIVII